MSDQIQLGDVVRDTVTGFKGVCVAVTDWLHGCRRVVIQPQTLHEGKPIEALQFDEPQCEIVKRKVAKVGRRDTGGPAPMPTKPRT